MLLRVRISCLDGVGNGTNNGLYDGIRRRHITNASNLHLLPLKAFYRVLRTTCSRVTIMTGTPLSRAVDCNCRTCHQRCSGTSAVQSQYRSVQQQMILNSFVGHQHKQIRVTANKADKVNAVTVRDTMRRGIVSVGSCNLLRQVDCFCIQHYTALVLGYLWPPCVADSDILFHHCAIFYYYGRPWQWAGHYILQLWLLSSSSFLSVFHRLFSAVGNWISAILPHMVWPYYGRPMKQGPLYFCPVVTIFVSFFLSFFYSSPNLSGRRLDVYHTWCGLSANLECTSEMCCTRLAEIQDAKCRQKSPSGHHRTSFLGCIFAIKARIDNREKSIKQQYLSHMSSQYGELGPTNG